MYIYTLVHCTFLYILQCTYIHILLDNTLHYNAFENIPVSTKCMLCLSMQNLKLSFNITCIISSSTHNGCQTYPISEGAGESAL